VLKRLTKRLRAAGARVAHYALGIAIAERRIRHFRRELHREILAGGLELEHEARLRAKLRFWRERRAKLERLRADWRGIERRRRKKREKWLAEHPPAPGDWPTFDGQPVPPWMVGQAPSKTRSGKTIVKNWLQALRDHGWGGRCISGIRTEAHSIELCEEICGAPSCSGTCAGATSNHNCKGQCAYPEGAGDFTDPDSFNEASREIDCPLINDLPLDPNHHSVSGR